MAGEREAAVRVSIDPVLVRLAGRALLATGQTVRDAADVIERQERDNRRLQHALLDIRRALGEDQGVNVQFASKIEQVIARALQSEGPA